MTALPYIAAYLLGAISFGVFVLVVMVRIHREPPGVTMHARRDQHEFVHRKHRDAPLSVDVPPPWEREPVDDLKAGILAAARAQGNSRFAWQTEQKLKQSEVGGIRYEHLGMTGHESD